MLYTNENKDIIQDYAPYTAPDGTQYPANFPKGEISSLRKATETARPTDASLVVTGFHINDSFVQVWDTRVKTAEEVKFEHNSAIQSQIDALEAQITKRMLREAIIGSTKTGLGQDKSKTAKAYMEEIGAQIEALAAQRQ